MPRSARERDGLTSTTSVSTRKASPGRVGFGQLSVPPVPISSPASRSPPVTSSLIVRDAVCQPLAARPSKNGGNSFTCQRSGGENRCGSCPKLRLALCRKAGAARKIGQILERTLCGAAGERAIGGTGIALQRQDGQPRLGGVEVPEGLCGI